MHYIPLISAFAAVAVAIPTAQHQRRQAACPAASTLDTPTEFMDNPGYITTGASPPSTFSTAFTNLQAATQQSGYLNYEIISSYDPSICATNCVNMVGCVAFNIYYERQPTVVPYSNCTNPSSEVDVKCAYYDYPVQASTAINTGQYQDNFIVEIAGSNGYNLDTVPSVPGYSGQFLDNAAINAPFDCNSYITVKEFDDSTFNPQRCADACDQETAYNKLYLRSRAVCRFFVTYLKYKNGLAQSQECALYTASWNSSYATDTGYSYESDVYTFSNVYAYSNTTNPELGSCNCGIGSTCNMGTGNFSSPAARFL